MRIKVGNVVYSGKEEPVMVILNKQDKINIANMLPDATRYCVYPDTWSVEEIEAWMRRDTE